ncbi:Rne/Rng family ribonuclease [Psychrobacter pygoscelis]|uniref:Rne/Rng family ribonuclease n=1 Tax=Psychrobacter pygoscelis TaxID=2488563 RepID=UPI00103F6DF7|nr:Rne/Rng family ribonuclease [Psychrobacter pygoscelis]
MKRILINATHNEEIRVALCKGNHLYDFDLENRTREQKKSNIYKGHVTRVEPSLEAVFVEYGSQRQGFLPIREIANEYLKGNARDENIRKLIKEGDELIVQVEKEERGNKGAALSTYVSLAGRYLVLMPNNPRGGGISRQISGKLREDMKRMLGSLDLPKGMSVIIRTAGIGKTQEDLQHDLNHLLNIWQAIQEQNKKYPSPRLVHQEAGVVTRAVRDYLRDDITEIWIDNENAYIEAAGFIDAVMPKQADKLRKYTDFEPMFARFGIEKQIETAYQREVRLPSGGSIVIDQTEALVSIDINSAKSTKGSDVAETAYHTNLEAADEIARQLRLRDMGGLIVIDFIDMNDSKHQKEVEKRLIEATKYDRARVQFGDISRFGLMEMSRQRLRPSLEESTGYICPRCHGNGMIRDLRSLSLSIMRQIEQIALKERQGEVQAEVPTDIAAFLLNEKRDSLVYLEQDSGTRITILPHAHLESPNFKLHFNRDGFAPSSYERITDTQQQESNELGYDVDWQTAEKERPEQQPTRQPRQVASSNGKAVEAAAKPAPQTTAVKANTANTPTTPVVANTTPATTNANAAKPHAVAWLSNLFAPTPQATTVDNVSSQAAAEAIEAIVNSGAQSLGALGQVDPSALVQSASNQRRDQEAPSASSTNRYQDDTNEQDEHDKKRRKPRKGKSSKSRHRKDKRDDSAKSTDDDKQQEHNNQADTESSNGDKPSRRPANSRRDSRGQTPRSETLTPDTTGATADSKSSVDSTKDKNRGNQRDRNTNSRQSQANRRKSDSGSKPQNPNEVSLQVNESPVHHKEHEVVHLSLDDSKADSPSPQPAKDAADPKAQAAADAKAKTDSSTAAQPPESATKASAEHKSADQGQDSKASAAPVATQSSDKGHDKGSNNSQVKQAPATVATDKSESLADSSAESEVSQTPNLSTTEIKATDSASSADSEASSTASPKADETETAATPSYDVASLFADRYVTAKKYGLASNDPRAVKAQRANQAPEQSTSAQSTSDNTFVTSTAKIRGTVGEFIQATLPDAKVQLEGNGVINSFIRAVQAFNDTVAKGSEVESAKQNDLANQFDFSNYGYAPLDATYLGRFNRMTQAVRQVSTEQGKTSVSPRPVTRRASNDPRGQHPDYQPTVQANRKEASALTAELNTVDVTQESAALLLEDSEVMQHLATARAKSADSDVATHDTSHDKVASSADSEASEQNSPTKTDVADTIATADKVAEVAEQAETIVDAADEQAQGQTSEVGGDKPQANASDNGGDEAAASSKTTIASYKNMIENVAEQLLPQQSSLFNLTTPKVPKSRSRKSKTEHKKPTQSEQQSQDGAAADAQSTTAGSDK